jgi:hypothetical protein
MTKTDAEPPQLAAPSSSGRPQRAACLFVIGRMSCIPFGVNSAPDRIGDMRLYPTDPDRRFQLILFACAALLSGVVVFMIFAIR